MIGCIAHVAYTLRDVIRSAFITSDSIPWPPSADHLQRNNDIVPKELESFLKIVFGGKTESDSVRVNRMVMSIGQDICRASTSGKWAMPKHILLCMSLRHMFRSKELITLINKFGHCESYSFSLELETAIAKAVQHSASMLPKSIVRQPQGNSVFHSEFDNFDKIVNELYGAGSIHTAHGIMLQETEYDAHEEQVEPRNEST